MERTVVVTDSTANLPEQLVEEYRIPTIPLSVHWGTETYLDGVSIDIDTFYRWLQERDEFPTTSQPSAGAFIEFFRDVQARFQADTIVGVFISSKLSGTFSSAMQARAQLPDMRIELVDSLSVSMGLGMQVLAGVRAAREGASPEDVLSRVYALRDKMQLLLSVNTLDYLHRGGRIGGAARILGAALNLKPVLSIEDGRVEALEKVRSRRKSLQRLVDLAASRLGGRRPEELAVVAIDCPEDAEMLTSWVVEQLNPRRLYRSRLTPVIGVHGGPGTIGIAFYPEEK